MKNVLLLGAAGQLGTAISKVFDEGGIKLSALTRAGFDADSDIVPVRLTPYREYDYLINCIAYHKVDQCEDNASQSFKINAELVHNLARFCSANDITFIHISTDYVFDGFKREAYVEQDLPSPLNVYGTSKLAGEMLARAYAPKHFVLRVSSMFGEKTADITNVNFVEKMVDAAKRGEPLKVIDDQMISPTYTEDAAHAIQAIIEKDVTDYGLYHACNSGECSWYDFASKIFELTGLTNELTPITYSEFHAKARRPQYCSMDNSKLGKIHRMRLWSEALAEYIAIKQYGSKRGEK